jgi:hypothetical protein
VEFALGGQYLLLRYLEDLVTLSSEAARASVSSFRVGAVKDR